jgi:hypothetical protein
MSLRRLTLCAVGVAAGLVVRAASARAGTGEDESPASPATLTQEWIGIELTPLALARPDKPAFRQGSVSTFQAGPGANIRFGRHRWQYGYAIPLELGVFFSTAGTQSVFAHIETEGGLIVPGTDRRLEVGLGFGLGVLSMAYSVECDGTCALGGAGWMVSLVARYVIIDRPTWMMGVDVRAVYPQQDPDGEWFGYYVGGGKMLLAGLEFGFGRR